MGECPALTGTIIPSIYGFLFIITSKWRKTRNDLTKHIGGLLVTEQLMELCRISKDSYIKAAYSCFVGRWWRQLRNLSIESFQVSQKGK